MANPFEKRATEYLEDNTAFLSVVTPEPLAVYFKDHAGSGALFDRLCLVVGTPGSGKTTIAKLLEFGVVNTLVKSPNLTDYAALYKALNDCKIIENGDIQVLGCRINMESEYREFWELPYDNNLKFGLLCSYLQSKALILWLQSLETTQYVNDLSEVKFIYKEGHSVVSDSLGGFYGNEIIKKAKSIEKEIYQISAALIPPPENELSKIATSPFRPFEAIEKVVISKDLLEMQLQPLIILDDVHYLDPNQLSLLKEWLSKREMKISRWMLMRLDAQTPENIFEGIVEGQSSKPDSTVKKSREVTEIWLQNSRGDRKSQRKYFRTMAKNMADKYLDRMPIFSQEGIKNFQDILSTESVSISNSKCEELENKAFSLLKKYSIPIAVKEQFEKQIQDYVKGSKSNRLGRDVQLVILLIMLSRHVVRSPQASFFDNSDVDSSKPIKPDASVAEGARIFLMHNYDRPYYYGIDALCDGSGENAEQFLQLSGYLVNIAQKKLSQGDSAILSPRLQHKLIMEKAVQEVTSWSFPLHYDVKRLCDLIAKECVEKSLEPNASLGGGANAFGIPENQFTVISTKCPTLAKVLKFGVSYGAFSIIRHYGTKNTLWALIELSGPYLITSKLTFNRGGFIEKELNDINIFNESKK